MSDNVGAICLILLAHTFRSSQGTYRHTYRHTKQWCTIQTLNKNCAIDIQLLHLINEYISLLIYVCYIFYSNFLLYKFLSGFCFWKLSTHCHHYSKKKTITLQQEIIYSFTCVDALIIINLGSFIFVLDLLLLFQPRRLATNQCNVMEIKIKIFLCY